MKSTLPALAFCTIAFLGLSSSQAAPKADSLDNLKKLEITCLAPAWLPEGYHVKNVELDHSDHEGGREFVGYSSEYGNGKKGLFTIESARWGIGDRNLDQDERAEETQFNTKRYGPVYVVYFPPGKTGVKKRILSNWIQDENMRAEMKHDKAKLAVKGRFHGVSGFNMTLAEFEKIVQSLHPISEDVETKAKK
ncbi:MAG: hypothetical protein ACAI37_05840 [Chthoniobacter sp.]